MEKLSRRDFLKRLASVAAFAATPNISGLSKINLNTSPGGWNENPLNEQPHIGEPYSSTEIDEAFSQSFNILIRHPDPKISETVTGLGFAQNGSVDKIFPVLDTRVAKMHTAYRGLGGEAVLGVPTSGAYKDYKGAFVQNFRNRYSKDKALRVEVDLDGNIKKQEIVDLSSLLIDQPSMAQIINDASKSVKFSELEKQEVEILGATDMGYIYPFRTPKRRYTYQGRNQDTGTNFITTVTVGEPINYPCTMPLPPGRVLPLSFVKNHPNGYPFQGERANLIFYVSENFLRYPGWPDDFICAYGYGKFDMDTGRPIKQVTFRSQKPSEGPAYALCPRYLKSGLILYLPQQNYYIDCDKNPYYAEWSVRNDSIILDSEHDGVEVSIRYEERGGNTKGGYGYWAAENWRCREGKLVFLEDNDTPGKRCWMKLTKEEKIGT